jgi:voltage-gated potassium channel Kch
MPPKSPLDTKPARLPFFTPDEWPVDLFFFRKCFVRLLERSKSNGEEVPVAHFQKAIKRLFRILGDEEKARTFDATEYDPDGSKTIGWSEFCECWKNNQITIKLSVRERTHLIFDPVGSSQSSLAKYVSYLILLVIFVSAISFVCGTMEAFKEPPADCNICRGGGDDGSPVECLCEPAPMGFFKYIEMVCIIVFTSEYVIKLVTAHAMRTELTRHNDLLELVCGEFPIKAQTGLERTFKFLREPSNVIDVLAIIPYFIERYATKMNFNLTFLRLIRLTRIFRIVRLGKMSDAADMLVETIQRSAPSLYVLGFCIVLGIVVCSSIVYFCESGEWDRETKYFMRKDIFGDKEPTPFTSIPATLWWTVVTVTTVGYGDMYPTSTLGKITGALTIVAGVIAFAMPIGVISSNFGNVWDARAENAEREEKERAKEEEAIIEALGFIGQERTAVVFEVYDDDGVEKLKSKPQFLGEVSIDVSALNFTNDSPACVKMQLALEDNKAKSNASVTGTLYCVMHWMPDSCLDRAEDGSTKPKSGAPAPVPVTMIGPPPAPETSIWEGLTIPQLLGQFSVEIQSATGLINLDTRLSGLAHPYCRVTVYTHFSDSSCRDEARPRASQGDFMPTEVKQPVVWQSKTINGSMDPEWQETKMFNFDWRDPTANQTKRKKKKVGDAEDNIVQEVSDSRASPDPKTEDVESFALSFPAERVALLQAEAKKWKEAFEALHKEVKGRPPSPIGPGSRRVKATRKVQQILEKSERDGFDGQGCSSNN